MNIFDLRQNLITDFSTYVKSFIQIRNPRIERYVQNELFHKSRLWPEPLIQLNPMFQPGLTIDAMVQEGVLHPACAHIFRRGKEEHLPQGYPLQLHTHQEEAIRIAREGHSYVLTTGTGSGKSLAYIIPIIDYVLQNPDKPGIKAIVVYPMNALANSQEKELGKYMTLSYPSSVREVTFRRYTGQENQQVRNAIIANPPDILLTNYVMLELILTRLRERALLDATQLRFLVLDELHTYRGRQGADVALLVRRVRDHLTPTNSSLQCIGTSATLAATNNGGYAQQQHEVAQMAERIFGVPVQPQHIIGETLMRVTDEVDESSSAFRSALATSVTAYDHTAPHDYQEFTRDPLSIWLESTFGVIRHSDGRLIRTRSLRISGEQGSAVAKLQQLTDESEVVCTEAIKTGLLTGYEKIKHPQTNRPPFAFRLHQFISRGDTVYGTVEYDPQRHITLQYQRYAPGGRERMLLPLVFCRTCGQEYYTVRWQDEQTLINRDLRDQIRYSEKDEEQGKKKKKSHTGEPGFLYIPAEGNTDWPRDRDGIAERLPGDWKEIHNGKERLIGTAGKHAPIPLRVSTDCSIVEEIDEDAGIACFFLPAPFRFCMCCGVSYNNYVKSDFEKLAQLSSEGRSTATTILSLSTIRLLREAREQDHDLSIAPKMLSFTDNRQDASLQAGHFNDFVELGLLRSALYCAVKKAGQAGLQHDNLAQYVFDALNLLLDRYAVNPELRYSAKVKTEQAFRNVLGYRLYLDLRRGWRITSPNLEQCGLLHIEYQDLDLMCADETLWGRNKRDNEIQNPLPGQIQKRYHEVLRSMPAQTRKILCQTLLDYMRRELAIKVDYLHPARQDEIKQQSSQHLIAPWSIDEDEEMLYATKLFPRSRGKENDWSTRYLSGLSTYGRYVRRIVKDSCGYQVTTDERQEIIEHLFAALKEANLVEEVEEARGESNVPGYQLPASMIIWRAGDGTEPYHDPLRMPNLPEMLDPEPNRFFKQFYEDNAEQLDRIENIRAAEHTAQVPAERRESREDEFRAGTLPILYCSPTMELGVDIAELNIVNMRNIPPTPANYAQRSGRAGRGGQPALVFSYCSTGSSHDQYFFQHPEDMVSGAVTSPRLDLTNEDLIRAHVHAIWLSEVNISLGDSLKDLLEIVGNEPTLEVQEYVLQALRKTPARQRAQERAQRVLQTLQDVLTEDKAPWYTSNWLSYQLSHIEQSFEEACGRWRGLYRAAQAQRDLQHAIVRDASRSEEHKKQARRLRSEAEAQLELLTASSSSERSDMSEFYSYRYFASEGFLPGYNFPRLPLSAYIPARRSKQRDEYLSRPRFLAISEFAPRAIVYHEGSRYIINRSILSVREDEAGVRTTSVKQCVQCGYLHPLTSESSTDICVRCGKTLEKPLTNLFRLQNVSTRRRDKISSDEEERLRQGYDIRTGVRFPVRQDGRPSAFVALITDKNAEDEKPLAKITYGQAATLWRINMGPLRRKAKEVYGFMLDTERGYWGKDEESEGDPDDPLSEKKQRVIPYVEDARNCLLFEPLVQLTEKQMVSLQAALKSAIQIRYQLEDNELAAEPLPNIKDRHILLLYEASEGGAGVLRQFIDTPSAIAEVAAIALQLCHFDPPTGEDLHQAEHALEPCEAACYHCLMTYSNQRDHLQLDRQSILDYLLALTDCQASLQIPPLVTTGIVQEQLSQLDGPDTVEHEWLEEVQRRNALLPSRAHVEIGSKHARPDFIYSSGVVIYVDGPDEQRQERDRELLNSITDAGYEVLRFGDHEQWEQLFEEYGDIFSRRNT